MKSTALIMIKVQCYLDKLCKPGQCYQVMVTYMSPCMVQMFLSIYHAPILMNSSSDKESFKQQKFNFLFPKFHTIIHNTESNLLNGTLDKHLQSANIFLLVTVSRKHFVMQITSTYEALHFIDDVF
jgi:hypothetical protein